MKRHLCHCSNATDVTCFCTIGHDHFEDDMYESEEAE